MYEELNSIIDSDQKDPITYFRNIEEFFLDNNIECDERLIISLFASSNILLKNMTFILDKASDLTLFTSTIIGRFIAVYMNIISEENVSDIDDINQELSASRQYTRDLDKCQLLNDDDMTILFRIMKEDSSHRALEAKNKLVKANLRLVVKIARSLYKSSTVFSMLDLIFSGLLII